MRKSALFLLILIPSLLWAQDTRLNSHGTNIVPFQTAGGKTLYFLSWSSNFSGAKTGSWQHDIFYAKACFDNEGNFTAEASARLLPELPSEEAREPVSSGINRSGNIILSAWEDGFGTDAPNIKGVLHTPDGTILRKVWTIAGGKGSQHSASVTHLKGSFLIFYADEAPPAQGGAVIKCRVLSDETGNETQSCKLTPDNEDNWWPVSASNTEGTRALVLWINDDFAVRGAVFSRENGSVRRLSAPQNYLVNIRPYHYQAAWLEHLSCFVVIARNGAGQNTGSKSQICLLNSEGQIVDKALVKGGILREAQTAVCWNEENQQYRVYYPSGRRGLTCVRIERPRKIHTRSEHIRVASELHNRRWPCTGISSQYNQETGSALFVFNDRRSDGIITTAVQLGRQPQSAIQN